MNENKEKVTDNIKPKSSRKSAGSASNPLARQTDTAKKPTLRATKASEVLKTAVETSEITKTPLKEDKKTVSNPILTETSDIVARINNFNTHKTANKFYAGGYINANSHRVVDYNDLMFSFNSAVADKKNAHDFFAAVHDLFTEKLKSVFTAFGIFYEKSKCLNLKLFNSVGNTYTSKLFLSDDENPVIKSFTSGNPLITDDNDFLNIPYLPKSSMLIMPMNAVNGCIGVMIVGRNDCFYCKLLRFVCSKC